MTHLSHKSGNLVLLCDLASVTECYQCTPPRDTNIPPSVRPPGQSEFDAMAGTRLGKRGRGATPSADHVAQLRQRHTGVLGLCAFVNAAAYDVPEHLPQTLMVLGDHVNDPPPIQVGATRQKPRWESECAEALPLNPNHTTRGAQYVVWTPIVKHLRRLKAQIIIIPINMSV